MILRLLVDECVQGAVAAALAEEGHDLRFVAHGSGLADLQVAELARSEDRIILTQDYDFGELAVRRRIDVVGVILVNCEALILEDRPARVLAALEGVANPLEGHLTIIEAKRVRQRPLR